LGLVTEVHHGPGVCCGPPDVYRGPPEVYRGPCMKITCLNCYITYTNMPYRRRSGGGVEEAAADAEAFLSTLK